MERQNVRIDFEYNKVCVELNVKINEEAFCKRHVVYAEIYIPFELYYSMTTETYRDITNVALIKKRV